MSCPACLSDNSKFFAHSVNKDASFKGFEYLQCLECLSIYLNVDHGEIQDSHSLTRFHEKNWDDDDLEFVKTSLEERAERLRPEVKEIEKQLLNYGMKQTYRLLDFGCGEGSFILASLREGVDAYGIEPVEKALIAAKGLLRSFSDSYPDYNQRIVNSNADDLAEKGFKNPFSIKDERTAPAFDVVCMRDVLEHIFDPESLLKNMKKLLEGKGLVYIQVPSGISLQVEVLREYAWTFMAPFHRVLFSPQGLKKIITRAGYEVLEVSSTNTKVYGWTKGIARQNDKHEYHSNLRKDETFRLLDYKQDDLMENIAIGQGKGAELRMFARVSI